MMVEKCLDSVGRITKLSGKFSVPVLVAATCLMGCAGTQEKSASDAAWAPEQEQSDDAPSTQDFVASGDDAWRAGDLESAMSAYRRALALDKKNPTLHFKIGVIHDAEGNDELAEAAFDKAIALDPTYVPALERRGTMLLARREYKEAKRTFRSVIALDRVRLKQLALDRSATQTSAGAVDEAGYGRPAVELKDIVVPRFDQLSPVHAYNGLGVIEDLEGHHSAALIAFDIARQISPRSSFIYNNMGYSSYLANDLERAETLFQQAIALDNEYVAAWRNLALVHIRRSQYDEAIAVLAAGVESEASANNTVGYLCMLGKKYDLAERYFNRAIELSPTDFPAANNNLTKNNQLRSKDALAMQLP